MSHFIVIPVCDIYGHPIDPQILLVDTKAQIKRAKAALREAGIESAPIWSGEPDEGESVKTWIILASS